MSLKKIKKTAFMDCDNSLNGEENCQNNIQLHYVNGNEIHENGSAESGEDSPLQTSKSRNEIHENGNTENGEDSPSHASKSSESSTDYTSCQSTDTLNITITEQIPEDIQTPTSEEFEIPSSDKQDTANGSCPSTPTVTPRSVPGKIKERFRNFSGADRTSSTSLPTLNKPVTKENFLSVYCHLEDKPVAAIEEYLKLSDLNKDGTFDDNDDNETALHAICQIKEVKINVFNALLNYGANPKLVTKSGKTILHLAVEKCNNKIVTEIFKKFPKLLYKKDNRGWTPLHAAFAYQNENALATFVKNSSEPLHLQASEDNKTPLHIAIEALILRKTYEKLAQVNSYEAEIQKKAFENVIIMDKMIKILIKEANHQQLKMALEMKFEKELEFSEEITPGDYPLHILANNHECHVFIKMIVDIIKDADPYEVLNANGLTPFSLSLLNSKRLIDRQTSMEDSELIEHMIKGTKKTKRKTTTTQAERNPKELFLENAKLLLLHMELKHVIDREYEIGRYRGMTPLQLVMTREENLKVENDLVKMLVDKGAEVMKNEGPIIDILSHNYRADFVKMFLDNLDNVNAKDGYGNTIFHYATQFRDEENILGLLDKGADPTIEAEKDKTTPLIISMKHGSSDVYFKSIRMRFEEVLDKIDDKNLLKFFQTHLVAAAAISEKEVNSTFQFFEVYKYFKNSFFR